MNKLLLLRIGCDDYGLTQGVLVKDGVAFAVTLELPWRENAVGNSCIPHGVYTCKRIISPRFGDTFEVTNVHNRSHILFHRGNMLTDTAGCILVAEKFVDDKIGESNEGFKEFLQKFQGINEFTLEIRTIQL